MRTLAMHRGITVPQREGQRVVAAIQQTGMSGSEGRWRFVLPDIVDIRPRLNVLFTKPDLTKDDIFSSAPFDGLCACGAPAGAAYYALRHNFSAENDYPVAIEFEADIDDVQVDPRDFLCTAFQMWDRQSETHREWQSEILCDLFGSAVERYFAAAARSKDQGYRIAMCSLAAFDPEVVQAHLENTKVIAGRYGTRFSSAFLVKAPIHASRIKRVYAPHSDHETSVHISLERFISG